MSDLKTLQEATRDFQREYLTRAIKLNAGGLKKTAKQLRVGLSTLYRLMSLLRIE